MSLTDKQRRIMELIRRSTPRDGWYEVSEPIWPVVEAASMPTELVEVRSIDGARSLRLTPSGEVVMKYLI